MKQAAKPKTAKRQEYRDCHGIAFDDVRFILPARPGDWPKVTRVTNPDVCRIMHELHQACWECCQRTTWEMRVEAHHMFAGSRGKSDEACAIAVLCEWHHGQHADPILPLGRLLYLKWRDDRPHCDWVRATLLNGRFLPELIA